jgi:putative methionine-R-sulfoxide reductase with GAF domain
VIGVLDIDSEKYNQFDEIDKKYLNLMVEMIGKLGDF